MTRQKRATAQRAEWHIDVSDDTFGALAARFRDLGPVASGGCLECMHDCGGSGCGCGCGCCPYPHPLPAVTATAPQCHCFINHALTEEHRAQVIEAIDRARSLGDMAQVPIFLLQLTGDCPARTASAEPKEG